MAYYGLSPICFETVTQVTQTPSVDLGTRRSHAGDEYVYCYNATGSAVTQGAMMVASGGSGFSLTRSSVDALDMPHACAKNSDLASGDYFWGLTKGTVNALSLAVSAGDLLTVGTDGAVATFITATLATGNMIGKALAVATAAAKPLCYVRLFG